MEYNTTTEKLILPEYGRNIQKLVEKAIEVPDRQERNEFAQKIIDLMGQMYPHLRDINDYKHKLWIHLALMSNFRLDIDYPYEIPTIEVIFKKPEKLPYTQGGLKFKHYGKIIIEMAKKATQYPDSEEKTALLVMVATHMKKQYLTWNREIVDDEIIFADLEKLTKTKINIPSGIRLTESKELVSPRKKNSKKIIKKSRN